MARCRYKKKKDKKLRRNTHRERCLCYQSPLGYLAASSANSSHWKDLRSAGRSHWSCCLARRARWCSRLAAWTPGWGTRRCWARGTQSAPWCDPAAQSGHSHTRSQRSNTHAHTRARAEAILAQHVCSSHLTLFVDKRHPVMWAETMKV